MTPLLEIRDLRVDIGAGSHSVHVLRGVDLDLLAGQATGLVGESGSGKSTTILAILGLLAREADVLGGRIQFEGRDLLGADMHAVRGRQISAIFQNARQALHPLITVGKQVARVHRRHSGSSPEVARREAITMLATVGLANAHQLADRLPHQLSGGQCQRAMIAMALVSHPKLILADEPTSGLDVTVQRQVLETIMERVQDFGATLLLVTHDIGVVSQTCDRVAVMYAGEVVEAGTRAVVLESPAHPYTQALLRALDLRAERMHFVPGQVPDLRREIRGCPFASRCPQAHQACLPERPEPIPLSTGQIVRCVLYRSRSAPVSALTSEAAEC